MSKLKDFNWIVRTGNFDKLSFGNPNDNLYILDTGVIIDLENHYYNNKREYALAPFQMLDKIFMTSPIIIIPGVFDEIRNHKNCKIGNRQEISDNTFSLLKIHYEDSKNFFREYNPDGKRPFFIVEKQLYLDKESKVNLDDKLCFDPSRDEIRKDVWLASKDCFKSDYRKGLKDLVSNVDREVINTSIIIADGLRNYDSQLIRVNVLSSDEHVLGIIHYIKEVDKFKELPLRPIDTRNDLRSFIQEHE